MPARPNRPQSGLMTATPKGLYCAAGGFYIDPTRKVSKAIITHAHSDHCRRGHDHYLCSTPGRGVLAQRVQKNASIETLNYGEAITMGDVQVSLHSAGHILGSAQVRIQASAGEHKGETWVASGDYTPGNNSPRSQTPGGDNPTCTAFEPVRCDVFITESTFALPIYRWRPPEEVFADINRWWQQNRQDGVASVIFAYSLGKAQRLLASVDRSIGSIFAHKAVMPFVDLYKQEGIDLPEVKDPDKVDSAELTTAPLIIAPQSVHGTPWLQRFGPVSAAVASGWAQTRAGKRFGPAERGFVLSDHADWQGILQTIHNTGCQRVGVTHGSIDVLCRYLNETGSQAFAIPGTHDKSSASEGDE